MSTTLSPDSWLPSVTSPAVPAFTAHEIRMASLSYSIRSKSDWARKLEDPTIRSRWRAEALGETWGYIEGLVEKGVLDSEETEVDDGQRNWRTIARDGIRADVKVRRSGLARSRPGNVEPELTIAMQSTRGSPRRWLTMSSTSWNSTSRN